MNKALLLVPICLIVLSLPAPVPAQQKVRDPLVVQPLVERRYRNEYQAMQSEMIDASFLDYVRTLEQGNATGLFDGLREFIFLHSRDAEDQGRDADGVANVKNIAWMTRLWAACLHDADCERPQLKCDHRALAMETLLLALGRQARLVHVFGIPEQGPAADHSMVEVFNPDSLRWELQDPYYNVVYVDRATRRRASALEIVLVGYERFEPCSGKQCGADALDPGSLRYLEQAFKAVIFDRTRTLRRALAVVLPSGMPLTLDWSRRDQHEYLRYLEHNFGGIDYLFE